MRTTNKKGQVQIMYTVVAIALAMIAAGMALGIGANVTDKLTEASQKDYDCPNQTQNNVRPNDTYNLECTNSPQKIVNSTFRYFANNVTVGLTLLASGNYTVNLTSSPATVKLTQNSFNNSNATWDFQYTADSDAGAASNNATKGLGETAKNLPILGLVAMFGVIIVFVVSFYAGIVGRG